MNVLGVTFDSKLNWQIHVSNAISKAKRALYALRHLKPFFTTSQMRTLLDSYFYSVLYYNASIWLTPNLSSVSKHDLLATSSLALRNCVMQNPCDISFTNIHKSSNKCTPNQITQYQMAINLYAIVNENSIVPSTELARLLDQVNCTSRQVLFETHLSNNCRIGLNAIENKFYPLNKLIVMDKLSWSFTLFKKHMKIQFLKNGNT